MLALQSSVCVYNLNHRVRYLVRDEERGGGLLICQIETLSCSQLTWAQVSPPLQTDFLFHLEWISLPTSGLCRGESSFFLLVTSVLMSPLHIQTVSSVTRWISQHSFQCSVPCRLNGCLLNSVFFFWQNKWGQSSRRLRAPQELHRGGFRETEMLWLGPSLGSGEPLTRLCSKWPSLLLSGWLFLVSSRQKSRWATKSYSQDFKNEMV